MGEKNWMVFAWEPMSGKSLSKMVLANSKEEAEREAFSRSHSPVAWLVG